MKHVLTWIVLGVLLIVHAVQLVLYYEHTQLLTHAAFIDVKGTVVGLPRVKRLGVSFDFETRLGQLHLSWYGVHPTLKPGQRWHLLVKVRPLKSHVRSNPVNFNVRHWLHARGYVASGQVSHLYWGRLLGQYFWAAPISVIRYHVATLLQHRLRASPTKGLLFALTLGDRQYLTSQDWSRFQATGTSHLIAISGLHISLVAASAMFVLSLVLRCLGAAYWPVPVKTVALLGGWWAALLYSLLSGFSIPTQRAMIMLSVFVGLWLTQRRYPAWFALTLAAILVVLWNPFSLSGVSIWLSFGAVGALIYTLSGRVKRFRFWQLLLWPQVMVFVGLLPFSILFFHRVSWTGLIANLFAIPWSSFVVMPLLLGGLITLPWQSLNMLLLQAGSFSLSVLNRVLAWFATWPHSVLVLGHLSWMQAILLGGGILVLLAPRGLPGKKGVAIGVGLMAGCILYPAQAPLTVWLLNAGRGMVAVVFTPDHVLVFNAGSNQKKASLDKWVIQPNLAWLGVSRIDKWVVARPLKSAQPFRLSYLPISRMVGVGQSRSCQSGQNWQWGPVSFQWVKAIGSMRWPGYKSCQLLIRYRDHRVLLVGGRKHQGLWVWRQGESFYRGWPAGQCSPVRLTVQPSSVKIMSQAISQGCGAKFSTS